MESWISEFVQGLSPAEFRIQAAVIFMVLCFLLYRIYLTYHRYRYINDTATSRVASAAQGHAELKGWGELMPGSTITSPFSQRRCLWYQCIMEKREELNDGRDWEEVSTETSDELFYLQDESGVCVIIPDGAQVTPSQKSTWYGHSAQEKYRSNRKTGFFSRYVSSGKYRFTERLILVADPLYAIGYFETQHNRVWPESFRSQVDKLVETWRGQPEKYLSRYDLDESGVSHQQELELIRKKAQKQVREQQPMQVHHVLRKPPEKSQPFVISALSEEALLKKKRQLILFQVALFFLILYVLLTAFNVYPR